MTRLSLLAAPAALAVSCYAKGKMAFGCQKKIAVIHHGVDHETFKPGSGPRDDFVLAVGDLTVQKNFHTLIKAVAEIPGLRLRIAGKAVDQNYANDLIRLTERLGLQERVAFLGAVSPFELARLYRHAAVFAFPSTVETFGNPLLEAMASGCAILCSNRAAMPEVLGGAGLLVEAEDAKAWTQELQALLVDPANAQVWRERAIKRAQDFSWDKTAEGTANLLESAAKQPAAMRLGTLAWLWVGVALAVYLAQFVNIWPAILSALILSP